MATFTTTDLTGSQPFTGGLAGNLKTVVKSYEIAAALALNDVIEMVKVPNGATVVSVVLGTDDLDTGGSPAIVLDVGDGDNTDRFIDGATVGQAGGITDTSDMAMTGFGYTYAADDTIDVLVATAPATGATSGTITLAVSYVMPA